MEIRAFGVALLERKCLSHRRRRGHVDGTFAKVQEEQLFCAISVVGAEFDSPDTIKRKFKPSKTDVARVEAMKT